MKPETAEWFDKAEGDWKVAQRETGAPDPVWHVICFLAQQSAEKYLKAFLEEHNLRYTKTHDLVVLLRASGGLLTELDTMSEALARLTTFGVAARYPGIEADSGAAESAMEIA
jgi:HEPN domain-containing protein